MDALASAPCCAGFTHTAPTTTPSYAFLRFPSAVRVSNNFGAKSCNNALANALFFSFSNASYSLYTTSNLFKGTIIAR